LADFSLSEHEPVPDATLHKLIKQNQSVIVEGLARNWYHPIKITLYEKRWQLIHGKNFAILPVTAREENPELMQADIVWFLDDPASGDHWKRKDGYKLIIACSVDMNRVRSEERKGRDGMPRFIGTDAFAIDRIFTNQALLKDLRDRKTREAALNMHSSNQNRASYEVVKEFLEGALVPPEQFPEAGERIEAIFKKHSFPPAEAEKIKQAIWEFGNYDFKTRNGFEMIGSCLVIPGQFESFVKERYGIDLQRCELSGAHKRQEDYTPEELAELASEKAGTSVHEASIYQKTAIIDWTSRQYDNRLPIPEIVDLNEDKGLQERIEIYR